MDILDEFEEWGVEADVNMLQSNSCNALDSECKVHECTNAFNTYTINIMNKFSVIEEQNMILWNLYVGLFFLG